MSGAESLEISRGLCHFEKCLAKRRTTGYFYYFKASKKVRNCAFLLSIPLQGRRSFQLKAESVNGEAINPIAKRVCIASRASRSAYGLRPAYRRVIGEMSPWARGGGRQWVHDQGPLRYLVVTANARRYCERGL